MYKWHHCVVNGSYLNDDRTYSPKSMQELAAFTSLQSFHQPATFSVISEDDEPWDPWGNQTYVVNIDSVSYTKDLVYIQNLPILPGLKQVLTSLRQDEKVVAYFNELDFAAGLPCPCPYKFLGLITDGETYSVRMIVNNDGYGGFEGYEFVERMLE